MNGTYVSIVLKRIARALVVVALIGLAWLTFVGFSIRSFGSRDLAERSDCAIVLGAAAYGSEPSPVFAERIRHALDLYRRDVVSKIIFTGGTGEGGTHAESEVAAQYAIREGIPEEAILVDTRSRTTYQNLAEAKALMDLHVQRSAVIVSDPLHLKRASIMAKHIGIWATTSPTPTTRYRSTRSQFQFLIREVYFIHYYFLVGEKRG